MSRSHPSGSPHRSVDGLDAADTSLSAGEAPQTQGLARSRWGRLRDRLRGRPIPGALPRRRFEVAPSSAASPDRASSEEVQDREVLVTASHPIQIGFLFTVGMGLALGLYWVFTSNAQLLVWIAAALFIALGLDPVVRRIERWGAPRGVGVAASVLMLAALLAAFFSMLIPTVVDQTTQFVQSLPALVSDFMDSEFFQDLDDQFGVRDFVDNEIANFVGNSANITGLFGGIFGVGTVIVNTGFSVLIVLVLTLYFLASLPSMKYWAYRLAARSRRARVQYLGDEITSSVGHYVIGQSIVAGLNGLVAFIAISIAGVPFGALLAFFAGLMAFIPLVGAMIGGTIITLVALSAGWQTALIFAVIYFAYLQVEAYFVSPRVMSKAVAVPGAVAVIAVIAGGTLLGVLGALMAIPAAAAIMLIVKEVLIPRQDRH